MAAEAKEHVLLEVEGNVAKIILNNPKKLNAMGRPEYQRLSILLREVAEMKDVTVTVLMGTGRFFSAGANVTATRQFDGNSDDSPKHQYMKTFATNNLELTRAFHEHPKILVCALNGPAIGLSAAMIAHCDFIYALPNVFLLTPFTSIGLVAEGGASYMFAKRMGLPLAQEALIGSKKITADRLAAVNFINKIFPESDAETFNKAVLKQVKEDFGGHLNHESMMLVKKGIKEACLPGLEKANLMEVVGGVDRFVKGIPQAEFEKLASGKKRHKL